MTDPVEPSLSETKQMGKEISRYQQRVPLPWWALLFLSILGLIASLILIQNQVYYLGMLHGQAAAVRVLLQTGWIPLVFLVCLLLSLAGLILYPRRKLILTEDGLQILQKGKDKFIRWGEITGILVDYRWIWVLFFRIKRQRVTVQVYTRENFRFDENLNQLDGFLHNVEKCVYPLIHKRMLAGLELNAVLHFGPIQIFPGSGIKFSGQAIQWEKISSLSVDQGYLALTYYGDSQRKEILRTRTGNVPNIPVLLLLVKDFLSKTNE
jgi:hypothetical protein